MEPEVSLPLLQKPATCHYIKQCCVAVAKNWGHIRFSRVWEQKLM